MSFTGCVYELGDRSYHHLDVVDAEMVKNSYITDIYGNSYLIRDLKKERMVMCEPINGKHVEMYKFHYRGNILITFGTRNRCGVFENLDYNTFLGYLDTPKQVKSARNN